MGTTLRAEIKPDNKYFIERHRYYELKHFCMQYPHWKRALSAVDGMSMHHMKLSGVREKDISDITAERANERMYYTERMEMIEKAAKEADESLAQYILKGVTEGLSYENLKLRLGLPYCRGAYYHAYRRFFWLLSKARR